MLMTALCASMWFCVTGEKWTNKVARTRQAMKERSVDLHVVTALDETACKFDC